MGQVTVQQFQANFCLSYLLTSNGECVLIDPHVTLVDEYKKAVKSAGRVKAIIDTHIHADHVSSAAICSRLFNAPVIMSTNAISEQQLQQVTTGDTLEFGDTKVEFFAAPGHTDDSIAVQCENSLFTGDVLLIGSVGRCDFQNGSPESMFETLSMFRETFPPTTVIYPAHDYEGHKESTMAVEVESNPFLRETDREAFTTLATSKEIPKPADIDRIIEVNRAGTAGEVHLLSANEANDKLKETSQWKIIDVRSYEEYRNARIEPSTLVPLETIGERAVELSQMPENLIFVCESGTRAKAAASSLSMMGTANAYVLEGGMTAWNKAKLPVKRTGPAFTLQRQIQTIAGTMLLVGSILTLTVNVWWVLLCLWVGLGLFIAGTTGNCLMAVLLLKMPWNKIDVKSSQESGGGGGCSMGGASTGGGSMGDTSSDAGGSCSVGGSCSINKNQQGGSCSIDKNQQGGSCSIDKNQQGGSCSIANRKPGGGCNT